MGKDMLSRRIGENGDFHPIRTKGDSAVLPEGAPALNIQPEFNGTQLAPPLAEILVQVPS